MESTILDLFEKLQVTDNQVRNQAEHDFFQLCNLNPTDVAVVLINICKNASGQYNISTCQSSALYLKRLILSHWSIGFDQFLGNPIRTDAKVSIRHELLALISVTSNSKLRSAIGDIIHNIAVVEYPDEWPDLMENLYTIIDIHNSHTTKQSMLGGLYVFYNLLDELITEYQFFEAGIGKNVINYCAQLLNFASTPQLNDDSGSSLMVVPLNVKIEVCKLLNVALKQLENPHAFKNPENRSISEQTILQSFQLLLNLIARQFEYVKEIRSTNINILNIENVIFSTQLFETLSFLIDNFRKLIIGSSNETPTKLNELITELLDSIYPFYENIYVANSRSPDKFIVHSSPNELNTDSDDCLRLLIIQLIQTLNSISHLSSDTKIIPVLVKYNLIPKEARDSYVSDFNTFLSDVTEITADYSIRDVISDYFMELPNSSNYIKESFALLNEFIDINKNWIQLESLMKSMESLFDNEDNEERLPENLVFSQVFDQFMKLASESSSSLDDTSLLCISRVYLMITKFIEKFGESSLQVQNSSFNSACLETLNKILDLSLSSQYELIKASCIISVTYFNSFTNFQCDRNRELTASIQQKILNLVLALLDNADEDTPSILLEVLNIAISINASSLQTSTDTISLIFRLSSIDVSNIMTINTSKDCLESLFQDISDSQYLSQFEFAMPVLVKYIDESITKAQSTVEYSPELYLSLELMNVIVKFTPRNVISPELFKYIFQPLTNLLLHVTDDEILQIGGELYGTVISNSDNRVIMDSKDGINSLLNIVTKFLSPDLSDSAAMNVGSLVVTIVQKFGVHGLSIELNAYMPTILKSAIQRLVIAKHILIIQNLISVFCLLILDSPIETLDFLESISLEGRNGIDSLIIIWLDNFGSINGYEKIKENILALCKILLLEDKRVESVKVKGDIIQNSVDPNIIITRSKAKSMPINYTMIPAPLKIVKLLIQEFLIQSRQPDPSDFISEKVEKVTGADDDGWEDLEDIGVPNLDKLKSYVLDTDHDYYKEKLDDASSRGLKEILKINFTECIQNHHDYFSGVFNLLTEEEKKTLGEIIGF